MRGEAETDRAGQLSVVTLNSILMAESAEGLAWDEVVQLITHIGKISSHVGGTFVFEVNRRKASFKRPSGDVLPAYAVSELRKFLQEAISEQDIVQRVEETIVVIDHQVAGIYLPTQDAHHGYSTIRPDDPRGFHRHLVRRKEAHYEGDRVPEDFSFYERIAEALSQAGPIVVVGHGQGKSNAADVLVTYLCNHHPGIASRIVAREYRDLSALTEPQTGSSHRKPDA